MKKHWRDSVLWREAVMACLSSGESAIVAIARADQFITELEMQRAEDGNSHSDEDPRTAELLQRIDRAIEKAEAGWTKEAIVKILHGDY